MTNETNSGYDMNDTLSWYSQVVREPILRREIKPIKDFPILQTAYAQLHDFDVLRTLGLFPRNAVERSILDKISWQKPLWFSKASIETGVPTQTRDLKEAISNTAIIPGHTGYYLDKDGKLRASIDLYQLESWIAPLVRRAVNTEALAHEFAHTILAPALYREQKLRLPNGGVVDAHDFLMDLGAEAEQLTPVSHYAGAYRAGDGKYLVHEGDKTISISEEFAETIAQMVLPFALHNRKCLSREQNLASRSEIVAGLESFLNAQEIS